MWARILKAWRSAGGGVLLALTLAGPAAAWDDLGHRVTALIAYRHLSASARLTLDKLVRDAAGNAALLAQEQALSTYDKGNPGLNPGNLAELDDTDFAGWATWADRIRSWYPASRSWHYLDIELDDPNLDDACHGYVHDGKDTGNGTSAQNCLVNKIYQFKNNIMSSKVDENTKIIDIKFLVHLIGDLHQPLHVADDHDAGGNCVFVTTDPKLVAAEPKLSPVTLHTYWESTVVEQLGPSPDAIASALDSDISPNDEQMWTQDVRQWFGNQTSAWAANWALETFAVARDYAYDLPEAPTCDDKKSRSPILLSAPYQSAAEKQVAVQLRKAGIRIAYVLNQLLSGEKQL